MICDTLFRRMGFHWRQRADGAYRVVTPFTFEGGEPIGLYLSEGEKIARISDNADTIFHLRGIGLDVGDRRKWKWVASVVETFKMRVERTGEIVGEAPVGAVHSLVSNYIGAMLALVEMERDALNVAPESESYVDEVAGFLGLWRPNDKFIRGVLAKGHSGREHLFHFQLGDELIDAAKPHSSRTGSILRKAADIHNSSHAHPILVVMDDREDPDRASAESDILSTLVSVLPMSRLVENLSGAPHRRPGLN